MSASLTLFLRAEYVLSSVIARGEGREFWDQVSMDHGHLGQAASECDSHVRHCIYREVLPKRARGAGGLPTQGEVD